MNEIRSLALFCTLAVTVSCLQSKNDPELPGLGTGGSAGATGGSAGSFAAGSGGGPKSEPGITIIQEDELGFSGIDGLILPRQGNTSVTGYTGTGFADSDPGIGKAISWSVEAESAGTYSLSFRYAFGGDAANVRDARLLVNGSVAVESVAFPYTTTWNDWQETPPLEVELAAGYDFIRLEALYPGGLPNIDYIRILGEGITPATASFTLTVHQNDPNGGTVSYSPVEAFYAAGSSITLSATANPGYFFQSWSGDVSGAGPELTFSIDRNTTVEAVFLPEGTTQDPALVGYATVQDDAGTPYIVTGGSLGESVTATTLDELREYLGRPEPLVVSFSGTIAGSDAVEITSHKTLLGVGDSAHLQGIELAVNDARNVIIRNVAVSHVVAEGAGTANDAIVISNSKNVWIDHCDLYSDREHGKDYYDGLLEIKNASAFITVSWTRFHDHFKASLISSGDEQVADTAIRVTYHHNHFQNCGSRLPSIRFGKAHVFNNHYQNNTDTGINSRMGAVVKIENNYFQSSNDPIGSWDSPLSGSWEVSNNVFDACTGSQPTASTGSLAVPYAYSMDEPANVPSIVAEGAGTGKL